jgi:nickel/cobalt exporter
LPSKLIFGLAIAAAALIAMDGTALAQIVHHPFAVGASEGAVGHQNALGAWILGQESRFYLALTHAVRAAKAGPGAAFGLIGLSFGYGIFHAAGPGHGKAVITSYMVSNEVALRRGLVIALLAAVLQGLVATTLVGIAAFVFDATAPTMTAASQTIELASYLGIVALGLLLVWRKGRALAAAAVVRAPAGLVFAASALAPGGDRTLPRGRFFADDGLSHPRDCDCGHSHMPDPALLGGKGFDWKAAGIAVFTAGARPCSGAILVLVFALAQGIFVAGVAATFAMALGTAMTTGALAIAAVFAKDTAMRLSGAGSSRALLVGRLVEFAAAACVLLFGVALLAAALSGVHAGG